MYEPLMNPSPLCRGCVAALVAFSVALSAFALEPEKDDFPLGRADFPVSCTDKAQKEFNHGILLLHHMTYPQARATFERVAELDSDCAMAYWGVAMTLFQPLWPTRPGPGELQLGWASVQRAEALAPPSERERLFIAAVEAFFQHPESSDYWQRIRRWEQASEKLYRAFPDDPEAAAFYALAHLAVAPSSETPLDHHAQAAEILLPILEVNPIHPGAVHYLIHANDIDGRQNESLEIVRGYGDIAPRNPHALHMPTHIYTRLGDWDGVIQGNLAAAEAALEHPAGDRGQYVWDEFPHSIEYLVYAYLQQGNDRAAAAQIERLQTKGSLHPTFKTAFHLSSIPARYALERRAWEEAADLPLRPYDEIDWGRYPWPEAVTWFARGLGAAHLRRLDEARQAQERLEELEQAAQDAGEELFTRQIRVLRLALSSWIALAEGQQAQAADLMQQAVALEVSTPKHPVTPGPTLPAYELLGDLLLEQGQPEPALAAFKRSLKLYPNRFNSLLGAAHAAQALDETQQARELYTTIVQIGASESTRAGLIEARAFLGESSNRPLDNSER